MATYTIAAPATKKTTTANTEDVVILDAAYPRVVVISAPGNTAALCFKRTSGPADQNDTPITVMDQDGTFPLPPGAQWEMGDDQISIVGAPPTKVRIYSTGAATYWVVGYNG